MRGCVGTCVYGACLNRARGKLCISKLSSYQVLFSGLQASAQTAPISTLATPLVGSRQTGRQKQRDYIYLVSGTFSTTGENQTSKEGSLPVRRVPWSLSGHRCSHYSTPIFFGLHKEAAATQVGDTCRQRFPMIWYWPKVFCPLAKAE
jgi:hypothetical protein